LQWSACRRTVVRGVLHLIDRTVVVRGRDHRRRPVD